MTEEEKANLGGMKKLGIDLGSGITAGAAAAILSHVSPRSRLAVPSCPSQQDRITRLTCTSSTTFRKPADSMLSAVNKGAGPKGPMYKRLIQVGGELGFSGLWAGLGPRIGECEVLRP